MAGIDLKPHQLKAAEEMKNGCILCGGVGSGKSRTAIAYYYIHQGGELQTPRYVKMKDPKDLYIITTARKRDTLEWEGELAPFLLSVHPEASGYKNKVTVDSWNNIGKYRDVRGAFFIFDEQRLVGTGAWVKAFYQIAAKNEWILLSATPGDKWLDYVPVFVANGFYRNISEFKREHVVYKSYLKYPVVDRYLNTGRLIRLREKILIDMDFARETVHHDESVLVEYDRAAYKDILRSRWNPWQQLPIRNASEFCQCLRKVVNSDESRQLALLEICEKHDRVIVFYNYNYELDILRRLYYGDGVDVAEWNGFKHEPTPESAKWVYLVQYTAGCEGWNCIKTDTIVFYSQTYSYRQLTQAKGRIDRLNTPYKDLWYYTLRSASPIDISIKRALTDKKQFNEGRFYGRYSKDA